MFGLNLLEEEDKKQREAEKAQTETESEDKSKNNAIPKQIVAFRVFVKGGYVLLLRRCSSDQ